MQRRLRTEINQRKKFQPFDRRNSSEAMEFEGSLMKLAQLAKQRSKSTADFNVAENGGLVVTPRSSDFGSGSTGQHFVLSLPEDSERERDPTRAARWGV